MDDYVRKIDLIQNIIQKDIACDQKSLVHCDYYFNNVLVSEGLEISAVLDFSKHAVVGDKRLDAASICFLALDKDVTIDHLDFMTNLIRTQYGEGINMYLDIYAIYYAFYYADTYEFDKNSYTWSLNILNDINTWSRLGYKSSV